MGGWGEVGELGRELAVWGLKNLLCKVMGLGEGALGSVRCSVLSAKRTACGCCLPVGRSSDADSLRSLTASTTAIWCAGKQWRDN